MTQTPQPDQPSGEQLKRIFNEVKVIAVVGLSDKPERASYRVAAYLQDQGYRIIPVNPTIGEVLGEAAYARLVDIPGKVDVVDIFRKSEAVAPIVEEAIAIGARMVWMQEGVIHTDAAARAREAGLTVVMDRCLMKAHRTHGR